MSKMPSSLDVEEVAKFLEHKASAVDTLPEFAGRCRRVAQLLRFGPLPALDPVLPHPAPTVLSFHDQAMLAVLPAVAQAARLPAHGESYDAWVEQAAFLADRIATRLVSRRRN